jgi:hypothetical protein
MVLIVFSSSVIAPGPGPPIKPVPLAFVTGTDDYALTALQADDITIDLSVTGTAKATNDVLVLRAEDGTDYLAFELAVDYTTDADSEDNVTNVSLENVVVDFDLDNNKILATSPGTSAVSAISKMYIPKLSGANVIVVCSGATTIAQTGTGCGSTEGVTEELIYLNGYTGRYTLNSYSYGGNDYWEVEGVTGTGLHIFSLDFGGGDGLDFVTTGEVIDMDEGISRNVISRESLEYFLLYKGDKYKIMVRSVDAGNNFASIYVEGKENILSVEIGDSKELDLDHDGVVDIVLMVDNIKYPDVYLTISLYTEEFTFDPKDQTETTKDRGTMFGSGDLWSRFVGDEENSKAVVFVYLVIGLIFVGFAVLFGGKIVGKVWQAT